MLATDFQEKLNHGVSKLNLNVIVYCTTSYIYVSAIN